MRTRRSWVAAAAAGAAALAVPLGGRASGAASPPLRRRLPAQARWAVTYARHPDFAALEACDVVALDPGVEGDVARLSAMGVVTLGYLSLGEIARSHSGFARLPSPELLLEDNPNWPGTYAVDVADRRWRRFVLGDLAPGVLSRGFQGFLLDTLDTPLHLAEREPKRFAPLADGALDLVLALRAAFPDAPIMMNRGYRLLPRAAPALDAVLAESLLGGYDFRAQAYRPVPEHDIAAQLTLLAPARAARPPLPIYTLDYWNPDDRAGVALLYAQQRAMGHAPFVSTILLDAVLPEPLA